MEYLLVANRNFLHVKFPFEQDLVGLERSVREAAHSFNLFHPKQLVQFPFDISLLPAGLQEWLKPRGIEATFTMGFYTPPHEYLSIHIDTWKDNVQDVVKLNWQFGAQGSRMQWYSLKPGVDLQKYRNRRSHIGTPYIAPQHTDVTYQESTKIGTPTLINAGGPHSVINSTNEGRYVLCASIRRPNSEFLSFEDALKIFAEIAA